MKKRDSKRRWKARCNLGRFIPAWAIVEFRLNKWFKLRVPQGMGNIDICMVDTAPTRGEPR